MAKYSVWYLSWPKNWPSVYTNLNFKFQREGLPKILININRPLSENTKIICQVFCDNYELRAREICQLLIKKFLKIATCEVKK